jgi:hypothetical protein
MKKYSNYNSEDEEKQQLLLEQTTVRGSPSKDDRKKSPTSIETSSIDFQFQTSLNLTTPQKGTAAAAASATSPSQSTTPMTNKAKYLTPIKNESHGKFITPSKMPRQTSGNEETPTKSPFSGTLPDGVLSSPVALTTPSKSHLLATTTPIHKRHLHATSPPPPTLDPTTAFFSSAHYSPDVVSRAIFEALFGNSNKTSLSSSCMPWDEVDDDDEDGDDIGGDDLYHCKSVEPVDELWFTRLMSTSLLTSQALDYALQTSSPTSFFQHQLSRGPFNPSFCHSLLDSPSPTGNPITTPDDLLSNYINPTFITSLISQLPFEDERFTSPRLSVLKAIYKAVPKFRSLIANSLLSVSNQRFMRCKTSSKLATMYELDVNHTGTKIGDMYSYSLSEHVDPDTAYTCFPIDDIPYPPKKTPQGSSCPPPPRLTQQISHMPQHSSSSSVTPSSAPTVPPPRDHDISIIEMNLFMILTSDYDMTLHGDENPLTSLQTPSLFRIFLSIVITVLRCYGRRLGKTTEGVEQPNVLKSCLRALEEILLRANGLLPLSFFLSVM